MQYFHWRLIDEKLFFIAWNFLSGRRMYPEYPDDTADCWVYPPVGMQTVLVFGIWTVYNPHLT